MSGERLSNGDLRARRLRDNELRRDYYTERAFIDGVRRVQGITVIGGIASVLLGSELNINDLITWGLVVAVGGGFGGEVVVGPHITLRDAFWREIRRRRLRLES